jgi:GNAT superfamily N-acetyltransferase
MTSPAFALRPATADDAGFLTDMLVAAANWHPDRRTGRAEILASPGTAHYVAGWPRPGDFGVVAVDPAGARIGAAWLRYFVPDDPGYGFVAPDVPELSIAVVPPWRGRGVGRALLREADRLARTRGITSISLSVERANAARRLYASEGYITVHSGPDADTMVKAVRPGD